MRIKDNKGIWIFLVVAFIIYFFTAFYYNYKSETTPMTTDLSQEERSMCSLTQLSDGNLSLTVPPTYVYGATQADLDAVAKEHGYVSVTLNDNGSVTYVLTKEQHEELLSKLKEGIDEKIAYLPSSSKSYKDITSISANDDYTDFVINMDAKSISDKTSMAMLELKLLSTMYNAFNGNGNAAFHAVYYGSDGQVLADTDSDKEN
ncbi:MAG: hypothetical protein II799_07185 [Lachnospiraceae bacterium]|nr:hypothetical protein [Lachnospiraceae bacterium]